MVYISNANSTGRLLSKENRRPVLCVKLAGEFDEGNLWGVPQAEAEGRAVRRAKARADVLIGGIDLVQAA